MYNNALDWVYYTKNKRKEWAKLHWLFMWLPLI